MKTSILCQPLLLAFVFAAPGFAATGAETYNASCVVCHGENGAGATPVGEQLKVRDLRSPQVKKQTDDKLIKIVTDGQKAMPAFGTSLSAQEIKDVVKYVRTMK